MPETKWILTDGNGTNVIVEGRTLPHAIANAAKKHGIREWRERPPSCCQKPGTCPR